MVYEIPGDTRSYEAVADLSDSFYKFVTLAGIVLTAVTADTDNAVGVLQNKPNKPSDAGVFKGAERAAGTVMLSGVTRVFAGAAINAGVPATIDAEGRVIAAAVGDSVVGITETAATDADKLVSLLLKPLGGVVAPSA